MSGTYPVQASSLRKGGIAMLKGFPCKIVDMSTSKTGKHGHAKVNFTGIDIFTGRKYEDMQSSTHNMDVPNVTRTDYTLLDIDDGALTLLDQDGSTKEDLNLPEGEIGNEIQTNFEEGKELILTIQAALDQEMVIAHKESR